jgi:hypothetical protein
MLLLDGEGRLGQLVVLGCYALAAMPLRPEWVPFFPKVWALLALYLVAGIMVTAASLFIAHRAIVSYQQEPGRHWERILTEPRAIFSASPAVLGAGIVYQSISKAHYELRYLRVRWRSAASGGALTGWAGEVRISKS